MNSKPKPRSPALSVVFSLSWGEEIAIGEEVRGNAAAEMALQRPYWRRFSGVRGRAARAPESHTVIAGWDIPFPAMRITP